jgi:hypothetical protein
MAIRFLPSLFAAGLLSALAGCSGPDTFVSGPVQHETRAVELDHAELVRVELTMGAGELNVRGGSPRLLDAEFEYDNPALKPVVRYTPSSFRGQLTIEQPDGRGPRGSRHYRWDLQLNNDIPVEVVTRLGAGNATMNLGKLNLRRLDLNMGVGNLEMDLRGEPRRDYDVEIHGGVGNATVHLPSVNIVADAGGGIGNIEAVGLEKRDGRWISTRYADAKTTVRLEIKGGVGNIHLVQD